MIPLLVAAHGTRDAQGEAQARELVRLVAERLAPTPVTAGFVELNEPRLAPALHRLWALDDEEPRAVVVPLMLGAVGGHVRDDIPGAIAEALAERPGAQAAYGRALGHDPRLVAVLARRIAHVRADWDRLDTTVILVGRGSALSEANADHARLARLIYESGAAAQVLPAFAQVARPGLPEALNQAYAMGSRRIVVAPHLLFAGRLRTWIGEQAATWAARHNDVEVRLADVIGPCAEVADVVVDRYRECVDDEPSDAGSPAYLAGLLLTGKRVVVVGAGRVADRRIPKLLHAGALVRVVSPTLSVRTARLVREGQVEWSEGAFAPEHLDDAWYVLACTNDPRVNAEVAAVAQQAHVFCVRADDGRQGSSWTPATCAVAGMTVAVLGNRSPRLSGQVRDAVARSLLG